MKLNKPTYQTSEYIIKRAFQQVGEVKCRKKLFTLAQVHVYDIIAYLALLQSSALYEDCEINASLPEPASSAKDAQKAAQYVFSFC